MGAGDCPQDTQGQLLGQVLKLNLGFSEVQLRRAIRHLVKEFGNSEEALAWIPQDNFTILVNYILDNDTDVEYPNLRSLAGSKETKTIGSLPAEHAQGADKEIDEGKKGGKPMTKAVVKKDLSSNGYVSGGNAPSRVVQSHGKIEKRNNTSPLQRSFVDRNELRNHYKKKLCTGIAAKSSDQKTKDKGEAELQCSLQTPYSTQKKAEALEPQANKEISLEARPLMPGGCRDLATGPGRTQLVKEKNASGKNRSFEAALDDQSRGETACKQRGEIRAAIDGYSAAATAAKQKPRNFVNLDGVKETSAGTSSRLESRNSTCIRKEREPCVLETTLLDRQKHTHSVRDGCSVKGNQDHASCDINSPLLVQLEAFLKEGNCQMALQTLTALKLKSRKVDTGHGEGNHLEGGEIDVVADIPGKKRGFVVSYDISRGLERLPISCVNEYNSRILPENFLYVKKSVIRQAAHVDISFSRIGDLHCCCSDDCLRSSEACKCTDSTRGEYAYDINGQLIERLASGFESGCNTTNGDFITECCDKCRCSMRCGNRIVQRGITRRLQVFMTPTDKGWGVRALEKIPARSFVCEYLGEIATNAEQYERNSEYVKNGVYTYTMALDADFDMEISHFKEGLTDHEALVLDATICGNVSRFVNHRCNDASLFMRPVQIETRDTHYYHAAFFAARDIQEMEELTWDYGIDFQDDTHLVKAFRCHCKSPLCRDKESIAINKEGLKKGKTVKGSDYERKGDQNKRR